MDLEYLLYAIPLVLSFFVAREIFSFCAWVRMVRRTQQQNSERCFGSPVDKRTYLPQRAALSD
jgi:hypothetical protein